MLPTLCCVTLAVGGLVLLTPAPRPSSVIVATGLGGLAWTDWTEHRIARRPLALLAASLAVGLLIEMNAGLVLRGVAASATSFALLGALWAMRPGVMGFGDVKLVSLAAAGAAAVSWSAFAALILVTVVAGGILALASRWAFKHGRAVEQTYTIPLTPALCVGFVLAVAG